MHKVQRVQVLDTIRHVAQLTKQILSINGGYGKRNWTH
jgi:hypothetical protein